MSRQFHSTARMAILILALTSLSSCMVHEHRVGGGPNGIGNDSIRQYYLFFGLMRINGDEADHQRLTQDMTSYEIITEKTFTDLLISTLLFPLSVTTRTVTVNL